MTPTPVGMRCPECSRQKTRVHRGPAASIGTEDLFVTFGLIALCVIAFIGSGQLGFGDLSGSNSLVRNGALIGYGQLSDGSLIGVHEGEYWRLVTGGFLHDGLLHIAFNMYLLWMLGQLLEPLYGHLRFAALYFAALLCGSFGALILEPSAITVGASGAVFGLMGAAFIELRSRGQDPWRSQIGMLIAINLVLGFVIPNVSVGGHIGGLIGGGLCALAIGEAERRRLPGWSAYVVCAAIGAVAVVGAIVASQPPS